MRNWVPNKLAKLRDALIKNYAIIWEFRHSGKIAKLSGSQIKSWVALYSLVDCPVPHRWHEHLCQSECDIREHFDTNECPNIFVSTKWHEWISEYIHANFFDTNECPNKYLYWKLHEYSNIFEYSSRFYTLTHSPTNVWIYSYKQILHERMS